ncbi:MAG: aminoacyl-tRNA hydrolase, partial [Patescibacteria group bacterium]
MPFQPRVPLDEISVSFARSGGPGGQNVNKVATKAQLRWPLFASRAVSFKEKERIRTALHSRINTDG